MVEFTQSDLAAGSVYYVHTSTSELYMDRFIFAVTDGTNEVSQLGHSYCMHSNAFGWLPTNPVLTVKGSALYNFSCTACI